MLSTSQPSLALIVSGSSVFPEVVSSLIICLLIAFAVRSLSLYKEGRRVDAAAQARLGALICRGYDPSGGGWTARRQRRIYRIVYQGSEGEIRQARGCALRGGWVRFYDDIIIGLNLSPSNGAKQHDG